MLSFCKSCNNLNTYILGSDNKPVTKCQSCGRIEDSMEETCVYFNKFVQSSYDIRIDPDQCHDPTLRNTDQIRCLNEPTCPSNNPGYMILVAEKKQELENTLVPDAAESEFKRRGGATGEWILEAWRSLSAEQQEEYNQRAASDGISTSVTPRIVLFTYNIEKKLAYLCCLCHNYWKN